MSNRRNLRSNTPNTGLADQFNAAAEHHQQSPISVASSAQNSPSRAPTAVREEIPLFPTPGMDQRIVKTIMSDVTAAYAALDPSTPTSWFKEELNRRLETAYKVAKDTGQLHSSLLQRTPEKVDQIINAARAGSNVTTSSSSYNPPPIPANVMHAAPDWKLTALPKIQGSGLYTTAARDLIRSWLFAAEASWNDVIRIDPYYNGITALRAIVNTTDPNNPIVAELKTWLSELTELNPSQRIEFSMLKEKMINAFHLVITTLQVIEEIKQNPMGPAESLVIFRNRFKLLLKELTSAAKAQSSQLDLAIYKELLFNALIPNLREKLRAAGLAHPPYFKDDITIDQWWIKLHELDYQPQTPKFIAATNYLSKSSSSNISRNRVAAVNVNQSVYSSGRITDTEMSQSDAPINLVTGPTCWVCLTPGHLFGDCIDAWRDTAGRTFLPKKGKHDSKNVDDWQWSKNAGKLTNNIEGGQILVEGAKPHRVRYRMNKQ